MSECASCQEWKAIAQKSEMDLQFAEQQLRAERRKVGALRNQLSGEKRSDPKAATLARLLVLWCEVHKGGKKNINVDVDTPRAEWLRKALARTNVTEQDCEDAIHGATLDDWAMGRNPKTNGTQFNDTKHIFRDPGRMEHFIKLWRNRHSTYLIEAEQRLKPPRVKQDPVSTVLRAIERHAKTDPAWKASQSNPDLWQACCPAHEDKSPSLSIMRNPVSGKVTVKCWAGCEDLRVLEALGLAFRDLYMNADQDFATEAGVLRAASEYLDRKNVVTLREAA